MAGILRPLRFMVHKAQLETVGARDMFGNITSTTVVTMDCLAYQHSFMDDQNAPVSNANYKNWFLLIPNTIVATVGAHIKTVVDVDGNSIINNAVITDVKDYYHWSYKDRFKILMLDISKNG